MIGTTQRSFAAGEIAPQLYARTDLARYYTGLRTCRNFFILKHGGASNRPGTYFIGPTQIPTKKVRLIPFIFNSSQTYVLEFGDQYMRVIKNGAYIKLTAQTLSAITLTNPAVIDYSGADTYANGDIIYISGISSAGNLDDMLNGRFFKCASVDTALNKITLNDLNGNGIDASAWTGTLLGSASQLEEVFQLATPYLEADLMSLRFVQSADAITIVHPSYDPRELTRSSDTSWSLTATTFAPITTITETVTNSGAAGSTTSWVVTKVNNETGEESLPSAATTTSAAPTGIVVTITGAFGAPSFGGITPTVTYRIYRKLYGIYGYVGSATSAGTATFTDAGGTPDITQSPPTARNPFGSAGYFPTCVTYHQNRRVYAGSTNQPETVFASQIGLYPNFTVRVPTQDNDAVTWTMAGRQVNAVKHLLELGKLLMFTQAGEWSIEGDAAGVLLPTAINPRQYSSHGIGEVPPLVAQNAALFVQARGNSIRDLWFDFSYEGYHGNDLTIMSSHLFDGLTVYDWAYQQIPNSLIWITMSDGTLLSLTYIREQQMLAWARHDFENGIVENVCCIPEGTEDAVYFVVKRTINGQTARYVERMESRFISDVTDAIFVDAALTYDGTNTGGTTLRISGGTNWVPGELLNLESSAALFSTANYGDRFDITFSDGTIIRFTVTSHIDSDTAIGFVDKNVPVSMRDVARSTWIHCVNHVSGLFHLEGQSIAALGDGFVAANPNRPEYSVVTVTNGIATFDNVYGKIQVGLPITADLETLDIDVAQGQTMADKKKLITKLTAFIQNSRGFFAGAQPPTDDDDDPLENLEELKIRNEENYDDPVALATDNVDIPIVGQWNNNGRVFIRQVDPLPLTVGSITPSGLIPFSGGGQ